jgi:hypothetical protein
MVEATQTEKNEMKKMKRQLKKVGLSTEGNYTMLRVPIRSRLQQYPGGCPQSWGCVEFFQMLGTTIKSPES